MVHCSTVAMGISSELLCFLSVLLVHLLTNARAQDDPLQHDCFYYMGNFTANSTYQGNFNRLLSSFSSNARNDYGFYNISAGQNSDKVNAIALCRGDVEPDGCLSCINNAAAELKKLCSSQKEAIIWYASCMLRYSNRSIFASPDPWPVYCGSNSGNVRDVQGFNVALGNLLSQLSIIASSGDSLRKFAVGNAAAPDSKTIHAFVQCTPDFPGLDCSGCLAQSFGDIPECCNGKEGGWVVRPSCNFMFDTKRFYDPSAEWPPPSTKSVKGNKNNSSQKIIIIVIPSVAVLILLSCGYSCISFRRRKRKENFEIEAMDEIASAKCLQYDFGTIRAATSSFSDGNKLGQGGFGAVYKGRLDSGQEIAVKRLSRNSGQGNPEFKNEVQLAASVEHRNLVRLQGFCFEGNERLLIYEFLPNKSLDHFLFDPIKRTYLYWDRRYKIIEGIARGLMYLHEESRLRIVHRDLKASNVLLDAEMKPKISDFGMARLFPLDQTQAAASRIVGTYGYIAPEYAIHGQFSVKSDVFSFGVLILEIVSGQRNNSFRVGGNTEDLLSYAWTSWKEGTGLNLVDPSLSQGSRIEMMRCIHIALLCVQENAANRPTMASVVLMFNSYSVSLPLPSKPAFFMHRTIQPDTKLREDPSSGVEESKPSRNESALVSTNELSITEIYPR